MSLLEKCIWHPWATDESGMCWKCEEEIRQGLKIGCSEEIAYTNKWINKSELIYFAEKYHKNNYGKYLKSLIERMN